MQSQNDIGILPMYGATLTHRRWLRPAKFTFEALEWTMATDVGIPGLSHIPVGGNGLQ
jgi:hypothetical protein